MWEVTENETEWDISFETPESAVEWITDSHLRSFFGLGDDETIPTINQRLEAGYKGLDVSYNYNNGEAPLVVTIHEYIDDELITTWIVKYND